MEHVFEYRSTVTVGDTNVLGNMYFANYFKLQGAAREMWFHERIDPGFSCFADGLIVVTSSADCDYFKDFYLTNRILIQLQVESIGKASVELLFSFFSEDTLELHAVGRQKLVFADQSHRICRIPAPFKAEAEKYLVGSENRIPA